MIPETLDGWTLDGVRSLVEQGVFETNRFDFKEMLPHAGEEGGKRRLRRDLAAFANSGGGFLVFGVKDDKGLPAADRIVGLLITHDFPEQFGNYPSACEPSVEWTFKNNPPIAFGSDRVIHVVHIAASPRRPHAVFQDGRWWFCKRTNKGTEPMTYEEVRGAFLDAGRRETDLAWLRSEVSRVRDLAERLNIAVHRGPLDVDQLVARFDVSQLKALVLPVFGTIGSSQSLVESLHDLVSRCEKLDAVLGPMAAFAMAPRDRSYSGSRFDGHAFVKEQTPQTVMRADMVLHELARLLT